MSTIWFPHGLELHVENPGYGELIILARPNPYQAKALVAVGWSCKFHGPELGDLLTLVTCKALGTTPAAPLGTRTTLPPFFTQPVAVAILPSLQRAVALAIGGTDRFDRTYTDPEDSPHAPLCARCNLGTFYTPGALPSDWCEQHGHQPYGMATNRWATATSVYEIQRARWDLKEQIRRDEAVRAVEQKAGEPDAR